MTLRSPTVLDVVETALTSRLKDTHVALPARVETYDAAKQKVSVLPLIQGWRKDKDTGAKVSVTLPVVSGVPVVFPGAGGFRLTFPVAVGDTVALVFSDYSLDLWLKDGGLVDPRDTRVHHITDAIAIPGLRDFGHPLTSAPTDSMSLGKDGGPTIELKASSVHLGGADASQGVILPDLFLAALKVYVKAVAAATVAASPAAITTADGIFDLAATGGPGNVPPPFKSSIVKVK